MDVTEDVASRFWQRVDRSDPEGCWEWKLSCGNHGYGQWWPLPRGCGDPTFDGNWLTHRLAWVLTHGEISGDLTVDHKCRNRRCCNPAHLQLLSNVDNATNNGNKAKTHCVSGHPFDEGNTYVDPSGWRRCRTCMAGGGRSASKRLTAEDVIEARRLVRSDPFAHSAPSLAKRFGVPNVTMAQALRGKTWRKLPEPPVKIRSVRLERQLSLRFEEVA